jgi:hypothetical protein
MTQDKEHKDNEQVNGDEQKNDDQECEHEFGELCHRCRTCAGDNFTSVPLDEELGLIGYYCFTCASLTMISLGDPCEKCDFVEWMFDLDEEIQNSGWR